MSLMGAEFVTAVAVLRCQSEHKSAINFTLFSRRRHDAPYSRLNRDTDITVKESSQPPISLNRTAQVDLVTSYATVTKRSLVAHVSVTT